MRPNINIFIDMDGVLAKYDRAAYEGNNPLWERRGAHYFRDLPADDYMIKAAKMLQDEDYNVIVISKLSQKYGIDREQFYDKEAWLNDHGMRDFKFIWTRGSKSYVAKRRLGRNLGRTDILIDDYNWNLIDWESAGGTAVKYLNGINSKDSFNGPCIDPNKDDIDALINRLSDLVRQEDSC